MPEPTPRPEDFDPVGIDHDVVGCAGNADRHRRDRQQAKLGARVEKPEPDHPGHHQHAGEQQPRYPLAQAMQERQPHPVDQRRPQELQVVHQEGERERGDGPLVDAVLGQARGQRRADHRVGKPGGEPEKQRRQRLTLGVGPQTGDQPQPQRMRGGGTHA
jgi:hypothetical protein